MALWHNLASGAESGMDFSSRWFQDPLNISTIQTTKIIPAELNAYLYQMENNIAGFADMMGNSTVAATFRDNAAARKTAMNTLMYNATEGRDYRYVCHDVYFVNMMSNSTVAATVNESAAARKTAMNTLMYNATEGRYCCCFLPCSGCVILCTTCLYAAANRELICL